MDLPLDRFELVETKIICGIMGLFVVFVSSLGLLGLRALGEAMSDPFGSDVTDLAIFNFVNATCKQSRMLLASTNPCEVDPGSMGDTTITPAGDKPKSAEPLKRSTQSVDKDWLREVEPDDGMFMAAPAQWSESVRALERFRSQHNAESMDEDDVEALDDMIEDVNFHANKTPSPGKGNTVVLEKIET